ncbi:hepatoma-derived growth factor-like [Aplochiton taeniatus]
MSVKTAVRQTTVPEESSDAGKGALEGSSDEDEGALVIDEKNDRGGAKRKTGGSVETSPKRPKDMEGSDLKADGKKCETTVNDKAGPKLTALSSLSESKPEPQANPPTAVQLTADKSVTDSA